MIFLTRGAYNFAAMRTYLRLLFAALLCLLPAGATAQFENGSIVGTVRDSSGAVVPEATVTVTNTATGIVSTRTSNETGDFEVPALRVGQYNIAVSKAGFATAAATNIGVSIGARQRVEITLNVGDTATTVDVASGVNLQVETDTSQRGQIVTQYQTAALPLVSRNYSDLIGLTTGVRASANSLTSTSNTGLVREGSFNVNGQRSIFNNFLLDGMDNNAYGESNQGFSNQIIQPAPDSVAQFQVVTNNESAEYGRASGAVVNVAFAQGGNTFHGRVYEFLRNTDLNAVGFFHPAGNVKPQFNRNQFGGNFGGPILHDKLFFFLDYEGFRQARKQSTSATLPTPSQLSGVFSVPVDDPYTGQVIPAGTSIYSRVTDTSPIARTIAGLTQNVLSSQSNPALSNAAANNFATFQRSSNNSDKGDLRLDYTLDSHNSFFLRISDLKQNATDFPAVRDAARRQHQRQAAHPRSAGRRRLHPRHRRQSAAGRAPGRLPHQGRQVFALHWDRPRLLLPRPADGPRGRRRHSLHHHHRLCRARPPIHQPAVPEPRPGQSQDQLLLGHPQSLAQVRLRVPACLDGRPGHQPSVRRRERGRWLQPGRQHRREHQRQLRG